MKISEEIHFSENEYHRDELYQFEPQCPACRSKDFAPLRYTGKNEGSEVETFVLIHLCTSCNVPYLKEYKIRRNE